MSNKLNRTAHTIVFTSLLFLAQNSSAVDTLAPTEIERLQQEILKDPNNADLFYRSANEYFATKEDEKGLNALKQATLLNPKNDQYHYELSRYYALHNLPQEAFEEIDQAVTLNPNKSEYWRNRGIIANWLKKADVSEQSYREALKIDPEDKEALAGLKQALEQKPHSPVPTISKEPKTVPGRTQNADLYYRSANKHFAAKEQEKGLNALKQAIKLNPKNDQYHYELSRYYAQHNMPQQAFEEIDQAVTLNPNKIEYWRNRAVIANWLKNVNVMEQSYRKALKIDPKDKASLAGLKQALVQKPHLPMPTILKSPKPKTVPVPNRHKAQNVISPEKFRPFIAIGEQGFSDTHTVRLRDTGVNGYSTINTHLAMHYRLLYEYASATNRDYTPIDGGQHIQDISGMLGLLYHIDSCFNLEVNAGLLTIQDTNDFGIYNATIKSWLSPNVWLSYRFSHDLFRPDYIVSASPLSISLGILESNNIFLFHGEDQRQNFLNIRAEYNDLSDDNRLRHLTIVPSVRVLTTQHVLMNVGLYTDWYSFTRRYPNHGYYSPTLAENYFAMSTLYYGLDQYNGITFAAAIGPEKDETCEHFYLGSDLSITAILKLSEKSQLDIFGGYSYRGAPGHDYQAWSGRITFTKYL